MQDAIALLMEETGCERAEAELALEMCGYEVEKAVKAIPRLLKNIVVLKGKFVHSGQDRFGLLLVILNIKSGVLVRSRAVLSFNPAVYAVSLDKGWFEFEKHLYGCRLWDGSLQMESLEIERRLVQHFREGRRAALERVGRDSEEAVASELAGVLKAFLRPGALSLKLKKDILDVGQFHALRSDPESVRGGVSREYKRPPPRLEELLVLKIALEEDPGGIPAGELRAGDMVSARIVDGRDIARYLAKLFGGFSEGGPIAIPAPVEAIEAVPPAQLLARVRFSVGVCGDAQVPRESRLKAVRRAALERSQENVSWWRRFFRT